MSDVRLKLGVLVLPVVFFLPRLSFLLSYLSVTAQSCGLPLPRPMPVLSAWVSPWPPPQVWLVCWSSSRNSGKCVTGIFPLIMKDITKDKARWERCPGFSVGTGVHPPRTSMCSAIRKFPQPRPFGFYGSFISRAWHHWPLVIDFIFNPFPSLEVELKVPTL